jgi:hypothetical protein
LRGVNGFIFLLVTINHVEFLAEEDKQFAEDRVILGGIGRTGSTNGEWRIEQVFKCLLDPKDVIRLSISI